MKLMGIDYGAKRVGIALSDDGGEMAFAKAVLPGGKELLFEIGEICKKERVEAVVMGDSRNYAQQENSIMKEVHALKKEIEDNLGLPVYLEPELMTSMEAEQLQGHNDMHDASAAALILKSYIDRTRNTKHQNRMTESELRNLTHDIRKSEQENNSDDELASHKKFEIEKLKREKEEGREEEGSI